MADLTTTPNDPKYPDYNSVRDRTKKQEKSVPAGYKDSPLALVQKEQSFVPGNETKTAQEMVMTPAQQAFAEGYFAKKALDLFGTGGDVKATGRSVAKPPPLIKPPPKKAVNLPIKKPALKPPMSVGINKDTYGEQRKIELAD